MDAVMLSRLQFAVTVFFHFIFVPLTLGLSVLLAIMETQYVRTGDVVYKRMVKFWGKLFLINFALGVVTGITLEFQFGTNWSRYSEYVGDIFGSLLAIEATVAFFLESTFVAVWAFGWNKLSKKAHCVAIWLVAAAGNISALWIILANGWMQHPVGFVIRNGRAELDDFFAVITNSYAWGQYGHTVFSAWMLSGFFVLGIAGWHLARKSFPKFFKKSVMIVAPFTLILALLVAAVGHQHAQSVAEYQPAKLAAMESHWRTGENIPMYLLAWPDADNKDTMIEALPIPGMLSMLAFNDANAVVKGLRDFPADEIPPVLPTFLTFRFMAGLGCVFILLAAIVCWKRKNLENYPWLVNILPWFIPLPYLTIMAGWAVAEIGRQPWIVYGMMRTSDAVSPVAAGSVGGSLIAFLIIYIILGLVDIFLLKKYACKGPQEYLLED